CPCRHSMARARRSCSTRESAGARSTRASRRPSTRPGSWCCSWSWSPSASRTSSEVSRLKGRGRAGSRIHRGLTGERELVGTTYLADPALRREYAAEIAPRTGAALARILSEVFRPDGPTPARALDLGAGTGAASAALRTRFGDALEV